MSRPRSRSRLADSAASTMVPELAAKLDDALVRALDPKPGKRFASAIDFSRALETSGISPAPRTVVATFVSRVLARSTRRASRAGTSRRATTMPAPKPAAAVPVAPAKPRREEPDGHLHSRSAVSRRNAGRLPGPVVACRQAPVASGTLADGAFHPLRRRIAGARSEPADRDSRRRCRAPRTDSRRLPIPPDAGRIATVVSDRG